MSPKKFVETYFPYAKETEQKTGISAIAILAQGAIESGWGDKVKGNAFFGIKDTDGLNGNEQLLTTTEYSKRVNAPFPNIQKMEPVWINGERFYKYTIKDWFRKYNSPEESFTDHASFFLKNSRYAEALKVKNDPILFTEAISKAGYATAPSYAKLLKDVVVMIKKLV